MDGPARTALITSVLGTARVFIVLVVGFAASKFPKMEPLLTKETCRCISRVCALLFLPALTIASTGATLSPTALKDAWQLVVSGSFTIVFSGLVAWAGGRLFFRRPEDRRAFGPVGLAIAFPNSAGFPLLLMDALCEQDYIKSDFEDDAAECVTQATAMIFVYVAVWQMWFFGWGFHALGEDDTLERQLTGRPAKALASPTTAAENVDAPSRQSSPQDTLPRLEDRRNSGSDLRSNAETSAAAEEEGIVVIEIDRLTEEGVGTGKVTAASGAASKSEDGDRMAGCKQRVSRILLSPNIVAVAIGVGIAMVAPLQKMLFDKPRATVGTPTVAVSTLVMAGSLVQVPTVAAATTSTQGGQSGTRTLRRRLRRFQLFVGLLHVGCRLIVVPAVGFAFFWVARDQSSVMGENRLMHLILLIEFAMPSAAFVIVSLNQMRLPATAGFTAQLYLWHYGASMFTITAWTALAVHMVY
eukprot:g7601.t1